MSATILEKIIVTKRSEVEQARALVPITELTARLGDAPPVRDFFAPLALSESIQLIAEVKKASPSAGVIREDFDPVEIAQIYERHGAACISVLTDVTYFQGSLDYLRQVRAAVSIPVLRKDFVIDSYQLIEARVAGADAVLLIAECLDDCQLRKLYGETIELGMTPLIELYESENLSRVLETGTNLLGINNRNLHTFEVDLGRTLRLRREIPHECVVVGESGIKTHADVLQLEQGGVNAILVGESLIREKKIGSAVDQLIGR
ncbi:indole-3-glycerol phosphate synthase TrpC [Bythopirellula polymerisocia]|uniref:Indole-3-glycerol phosphate synthase n=1 Tax=Bythopirellula polymerisocia TaxID=2528003 RepID=A0A5C6CR08_9BACT|nr:indole-3-glycerol phosphate synthase TrpC [Bythopirellula polymerisocia]TWU25546.1 Indole-3-glycerol phosphate synthase [Bythopirellula polymerisocia]